GFKHILFQNPFLHNRSNRIFRWSPVIRRTVLRQLLENFFCTPVNADCGHKSGGGVGDFQFHLRGHEPALRFAGNGSI
ncbi:hypothetical protein, partial [Caldalkalibacillus thermarum]|uniref:hypothetical protein n=1 Tax=Caldalkalibacillus thermarum TaxID=296745 RepID=UPI001ED974B1